MDAAMKDFMSPWLAAHLTPLGYRPRGIYHSGGGWTVRREACGQGWEDRGRKKRSGGRVRFLMRGNVNGLWGQGRSTLHIQVTAALINLPKVLASPRISQRDQKKILKLSKWLFIDPINAIRLHRVVRLRISKLRNIACLVSWEKI